MKNIFQIVYTSSKENENEFHELFKEEALAMRAQGIKVGLKPTEEATHLMRRGTTIKNSKDYPTDKRYINSWDHNENYLYLSKYFPLIEDLSIETFFTDRLDYSIIDLIQQKGWTKVFIKKDIKALEHIEEGKSVWPNTTLEEMNMLYDAMAINGKFAIRNFIYTEKITHEEERYWVLNGNVYHRHNKIPQVVREAAKRLNTMGSKYYTIDATPEFIVEVNPGESSDRHGVNSAELFASWIKKEFDN